MITKSRMIVAPALAVAVATAGIAVAGTTGADLNDARVVSKVTPSKLDKKKFTPVSVLLGVVNSPDSAGNEDANPSAERIAWSKNVNVEPGEGPALHGADRERHDPDGPGQGDVPAEVLPRRAVTPRCMAPPRPVR